MKIYEKNNTTLCICLGEGENPEVDMVVKKYSPDTPTIPVIRTDETSDEHADCLFMAGLGDTSMEVEVDPETGDPQITGTYVVATIVEGDVETGDMYEKG